MAYSIMCKKLFVRIFLLFQLYANEFQARFFGPPGSLRFLGPHIWNNLPDNIKEITSFEKLLGPYLLANSQYSMDLVVNAVFFITKTKYLIRFISIYLIQYPCIIFNTVTCDCSDKISEKKIGDDISGQIRSEKGLKFFFAFCFAVSLPLLTDGTPRTFCVMNSSAAIFCGAVHNMER